MAEVEVALPPIAAQARIVAVLDMIGGRAKLAQARGDRRRAEIMEELEASLTRLLLEGKVRVPDGLWSPVMGQCVSAQLILLWCLEVAGSRGPARSPSDGLPPRGSG
jgi:hypothetical protein